MQMNPLDLAILGLYVAFAIGVGFFLRHRASKSADQFFLAGRKLPWWVVGTSMVATTFAADTPLVITGWVRDGGIWKNWLWWCFAVGGMLTVFLFSRYWRRLGVMTQAEFAELRYGGHGATALRGALGFFHSFLTNPIVLCWVLLAAAKISDVLFDLDKTTSLGIACAICLSYSLMSGFWGVAVTDLVQFCLAMIGAIALAVITWNAVGGQSEILGQLAGKGGLSGEILGFLPSPGNGSWTELSFWTTPLAAVAVYLGVSWWATAGIDGGTVVVQRIAASKSPAHGSVGTLWYNIANYALRPWMWIAVALASLLVVPHGDPVVSPVAGQVVEISDSADRIVIADAEGQRTEVVLESPEGWAGVLPLIRVSEDDEVDQETVIARTDSEKAYVVMMVRYLPVGLLGLVVASLLAAFMSTIDTHVNLASSYYVNDLHRRFLARKRKPEYYVKVARIASVVILIEGALLASVSDSISDLFTFFLAFLGGVGPIYLLRWLWWRITAWSEISAMITSSVTTTLITFGTDNGWRLGPLSPDGAITAEGRIVIVVLLSTTVSLLVTWLRPKPDAQKLVAFYQKVRPAGAWGPVRDLAGVSSKKGEGWQVLGGVLGGLAMTWGLTLGLGGWMLGYAWSWTALGCAAGGAVVVASILPGLIRDDWDDQPQDSRPE
ncbi:MAG: sodium:solute symporter family protein [Planctomycetota bacterium]|nr:sodium:solute symporter family protein [Planctomycetota bacterium]